MRILHVIREVTDGGASLGMLRQCVDGPPGVTQTVASLRRPEPAALARFARSGVEVVWEPAAIMAAVRVCDGVQVEWWNNPEVNAFLTSTDLPPCRLLLHSRGHFDAPFMCPSALLLSRVDLCTVTTPGAAGNPAFDRARRAAGLPPPACVYSAALMPRQDPPARDGKAADGPVFAYLGTVEPIKMHRAALPMAAEILKQVPTARFRFAGDGTLEAYRREALALGIADRVAFPGFIEQAGAFLQDADIFFYPLNPFTYATSEKALQEAMAAGLPCIVFPHGGIRDLVTPDCAAVVDDCAGFVAAAVALARDPGRRAAMGRAAVQRLGTAAHVLHWRDHLAQAWSRLVDRPRRPRAALAITREQLFACCTDPGTQDMRDLDAGARTDFLHVAAFVADAYGLDALSLTGGGFSPGGHHDA